MKDFLHCRPRITLIITLLCIVFLTRSLPAQYLHASGKKIVDKDGKEVILRSMGLGGWMLQEGYMLETNSFANTQSQIKAKIKDLVGDANTTAFYDAWLANHCTERDVDSLAAWGFNAIRLPMHYNLFTLPIQDEPVAGQNTWLDKGFTMTDNLLKWCAKNKIYLILDLHAAPGGQGHDAAISDYDATKPSLWESDANKQKTIALWKKLATRYANEPWIGGYDLINEPNWNFTAGANQNGCDEKTNAPLRALYIAITSAIREVDKNHIIFIEGNCWANNYNGLMPAWDNNMSASFHKYWNNNDQSSVQFITGIRDQYSVPVWLGESGENSNTWFTNAISLMEANSIGWAWWPMKKVNSIVNPLTVKKNDGYNTLLDYWKNGGTKPTVDFANTALTQLAENLKIGNNIYRKDVIDAMFRQVNSTATRPFAPNHIPGVIAATDFDLGRNGFAYSDTDTANYQVSTGSFSPWNSGYAYRNDGVDIEATSDTDAASNGYNVGWTADGEWLQYTLQADSSAVYDIAIRYGALTGTSKVKIVIDGATAASVTLPATGGIQVWKNQVLPGIILYKGTHKLRFIFEKGGANVGFLKFTLSKKISEVPFTALSAETAPNAQGLYLMLNKYTNAATIASAGFTCSVNGADRAITNIQIDPNNASRILLTLSDVVSDNNTITLSYQNGSIKATDATALQNFTSLAVTNSLPFHFDIPAKIEAEAFTVNYGLQAETTTDTGGGQDMGHSNVGDYLEFLIRVPVDGEYPLEARIACAAQAGRLEFQQFNTTGTLLNSIVIDIPVTGGWQIWKTAVGKLKLTKGEGKLRVRIIQPEFNINWIRFLGTDVINGVEKKKRGSLLIYPNPTDKRLNIEWPDNAYSANHTLAVRTAGGSLVKHYESNTQTIPSIAVDDLPSGLYIIELASEKEYWSNKFIVK
ncbi:MAG TPA: carbohydrate-binding protein [Ohtaekwangia sp.]|uniref:carbohydrate-binding protein n=1 Tax=Ohtaekwangia sp. TaxID=2066019 RepID=UPI002F9362CF